MVAQLPVCNVGTDMVAVARIMVKATLFKLLHTTTKSVSGVLHHFITIFFHAGFVDKCKVHLLVAKEVATHVAAYQIGDENGW